MEERIVLQQEELEIMRTRIEAIQKLCTCSQLSYFFYAEESNKRWMLSATMHVLHWKWLTLFSLWIYMACIWTTSSILIRIIRFHKKKKWYACSMTSFWNLGIKAYLKTSCSIQVSKTKFMFLSKRRQALTSYMSIYISECWESNMTMFN